MPKHGGRPIATVFNPTEYKKWIGDAVEQLIPQIHGDPILGDLTLSLVVVAQKPKTSKLSRPKPDVDNYAKAVMDAMTDAGVWDDDAQVAQLTATKRWGGIGRIEIILTRGVVGER